MNTINLREFQELAALSDSAMLWLLQQNRLELQLEENELRIKVGSLSSSALIESLTAARQNSLDRASSYLEEHIGTVISEELEKIVTQAQQVAAGATLKLGER
jgi:hypothetical protein